MSFIKKKMLSSEQELKQVIIIRADLKLPKGKAAAQSAHASVEATLNSSQDNVNRWRAEGMKKIVVKAQDEQELLTLWQRAKTHKLVASLITDAGKTYVAPGTKTALAIGPDKEELIDKVTGELSLY
jgi:peptidyl-tRNA hydrolase, PTH2 family